MKAEIHDELLEQKRNEALNTALDKWMEEAAIVYTEAGESWKIEEESAAEEATPEETAAEEPAAEEVPAN